MDFLAYLYTKYKTTIQWGKCPRGAIVTPVWFVVIIGFGDYLYVNTIVYYLLRVIILWLIIYSIIYALLPQTSVRKYYKSWLKRYKGTTRLWSVLYWVVCVIIAFTVATCRGR